MWFPKENLLIQRTLFFLFQRLRDAYVHHDPCPVNTQASHHFFKSVRTKTLTSRPPSLFLSLSISLLINPEPTDSRLFMVATRLCSKMHYAGNEMMLKHSDRYGMWEEEDSVFHTVIVFVFSPPQAH